MKSLMDRLVLQIEYEYSVLRVVNAYARSNVLVLSPVENSKIQMNPLDCGLHN